MAPSWQTQGARWMRHAIARRDHEMRLDRWLRQQFPSVPQSFFQAQLRKRKIRVLEQQSASLEEVLRTPPLIPGKANSILREGFAVAIDVHLFRHTLSDAAIAEARGGASATSKKKADRPIIDAPSLVPQLVQRVVYNDANYLILDKPHGLAVQEGTGLEHSLVDYLPAIAAAFSGEAGSSEMESPRLVHRLDKETSGLLVLARHRLAAARFAALLKSGQVRKTYQALVAPSPSNKGEDDGGGGEAVETRLALWGGEITFPVDGKAASTLVRSVPSSSKDKKHDPHPRGVWLQLSPVTGRKHQLRVHCAQVLHAPIVGDTRYRGQRADRLYLHAQRIEFPDPFALSEGKEKRRHPRRIDVRRSMDHVGDFCERKISMLHGGDSKATAAPEPSARNRDNRVVESLNKHQTLDHSLTHFVCAITSASQEPLKAPASDNAASLVLYTTMVPNNQQRNRVRGNGTFRIAMPELKHHETPEEYGSSRRLRSRRSKSGGDASVVRPTLYHACNRDGDNNGDVIFYTRFDDYKDREIENNSHLEGDRNPGEWFSSCRFSLRSRPSSPSRSNAVDLSSNDIRLESIDDLKRRCGECSHQQPEADDRGPEHTQQQVQQQEEEESEDEALDENETDEGKNNQLSVEPNHVRHLHHHEPVKSHECESEASRRTSFTCEPMVQYDFDSVRKSQQQFVLSRFARYCAIANQDHQKQQYGCKRDSFFYNNRMDDDDDDIMNFRSPVTQKPSFPSASEDQNQQQEEDQQESEGPQQQSDEELRQQQLGSPEERADQGGWTREQFCQYTDILGFLQEACASASPHISIPGTRLAQMEQLLRSLHPKA